MVNVEPPVFVNVSPRVLLLPVAMLPNERLVGLALSTAGVTPVPLKATFRVGFDALEVTVRLPPELPLELGENVTLKFAPWPTDNVNGMAGPVSLNPAPLTVAADMVTFAPPVLVMVSVIVLELPT